MLTERMSVDPAFAEFGLKEHSFEWAGQTVVTLEAYLEYYAIYWEIGTDLAEFAVQASRTLSELTTPGGHEPTVSYLTITTQTELTVSYLTITTQTELKEFDPLRLAQLPNVLGNFPNALFFRADTPWFDVWAKAPIPGEQAELVARPLGGIISSYSLTPEVINLLTTTNRLALELPGSEQKRLARALARQLKPTLAKYPKVTRP